MKIVQKLVTRTAMLACAVALSALAQAQTAEQSYPSRPIRFIVPGSPGGPTDITARMLGDKLGQALGQTVIVENRAGGAMMIGTNAVAKAEPDGYTLLWTSSTPIVMVPAIAKSVPYDVDEFVTVSQAFYTPLALYVASGTLAKNVKEMLEIASKHPERASYGSIGNGTSVHILNEIMLKQTHVKMIHVAYKGVAPELQDLMAGQILTGGGDIGSAMPLIQSGRIRAIAVTGTKRSSVLPDVPTFAEQGFSGLEPLSPWFGLLAPKKTPRGIIAKLSAEVQKIVKSKEFSDRLGALGLETTGYATDEADRMTRDDVLRWKDIVNKSGIKFD